MISRDIPLAASACPMVPVIVFLHVFNVSGSSAMLPMRGLPAISFTVTKLLMAAAFQMRSELVPSYFYKIQGGDREVKAMME